MVPLWKPAAIADRRRIIAYIAQDKPRAAIELGDLLMEKAGLLDSYPLLGPVGRVTGTRELTVHPHYLLIYRLSALPLKCCALSMRHSNGPDLGG